MTETKKTQENFDCEEQTRQEMQDQFWKDAREKGFFMMPAISLDGFVRFMIEERNKNDK